MMEMTKHATIYRANRVEQIIQRIGIGQVIKESYTRNAAQIGMGAGGRWICLTDTGITIIKDEAKQKVVTMYVTTVAELLRVYGGDKKVPAFLRKKVNHNQSLYVVKGKTIWQD